MTVFKRWLSWKSFGHQVVSPWKVILSKRWITTSQLAPLLHASQATYDLFHTRSVTAIHLLLTHVAASPWTLNSKSISKQTCCLHKGICFRSFTVVVKKTNTVTQIALVIYFGVKRYRFKTQPFPILQIFPKLLPSLDFISKAVR